MSTRQNPSYAHHPQQAQCGHYLRFDYPTSTSTALLTPPTLQPANLIPHTDVTTDEVFSTKCPQRPAKPVNPQPPNPEYLHAKPGSYAHAAVSVVSAGNKKSDHVEVKHLAILLSGSDPAWEVAHSWRYRLMVLKSQQFVFCANKVAQNSGFEKTTP
ncbi:hypothetical protein ILUMI_00795 [Ignelater luminosus]|uniref:Uncharacterized protein n=1 Tax=Ignelater luminosus TaxID=2038154 RepID=A0A8K0DL86_IGNLU|nr:hypothetical protein ILUMI_00795 [Ignelater luminosus]